MNPAETQKLDDCCRELECLEAVMFKLASPDDDTEDRILEHIRASVRRVRLELEDMTDLIR
jgi:hypothetical protein